MKKPPISRPKVINWFPFGCLKPKAAKGSNKIHHSEEHTHTKKKKKKKTFHTFQKSCDISAWKVGPPRVLSPEMDCSSSSASKEGARARAKRFTVPKDREKMKRPRVPNSASELGLCCECWGVLLAGLGWSVVCGGGGKSGACSGPWKSWQLLEGLAVKLCHPSALSIVQCRFYKTSS